MQQKFKVIKQSLLQIPIQQRSALVALKYIQDQIEKLAQEEAKQTQQTHAKHFGSLSQINKEIEKIVAGRPLTNADMQNSISIFTNAQQQEKSKLMKSGSKIPFYWKNVLESSQIGPLFSEQDLQLLNFLENLSCNVTDASLEVTFTFSENTRIKKGQYTRKLILQGAMPKQLKGSKAQWISGSYEGVLSDMLNDCNDLQSIKGPYLNIATIVNQIIPQSLNLYLGIGLFDQDQIERLDDIQEQNGNQQES